MNFLDIFGNTKVSISDSLFNKNNVKYVSILHNTCSYFTNKPKTEGHLKFVSNDTIGEKTFEGENIMEVLTQMAKFLESLK